MKVKTILLTIITNLFLLQTLLAQKEKTENEDIYSLSLEQLMAVPIESASKKEETLFDAPLASYSITQEDILRAGSTSVVEALRLAPGVVVREQTNGNYDVHIRGLDNLLQRTNSAAKSSETILVMIDNRPVFNYNLGGTFWESLPIDINDVERIEIVRGPASALFGPNAVTGVINIITKSKVEKTQIYANAQGGFPGTMLANSSIMHQVNDKFSFTVSANTQTRQRFTNDYLSLSQGDYVNVSSLLGGQANVDAIFPHVNRSMNNWGSNAKLLFQPSKDTQFDLSFGLQESEVQKIFSPNYAAATFITNSITRSKYVNLKGMLGKLNLRSSLMNAYDNYGYAYGYTYSDALLEYNLKIGEGISITPGTGFTNVIYEQTNGNNLFQTKKPSIFDLYGTVRSDIALTNNWRLVLGGRLDKFSTNDDPKLAYQVASTYKLNKENVIHAAITQSNVSPFIFTSYANVDLPLTGGAPLNIQGTKNLKLETVLMIELGYRSRIANNLQMDLDLFHQHVENLPYLIAVINPDFTANAKIQTFPTTAEQFGFTLSLIYAPSEKVTFKPFITYQKTTIDNLPSGFVQYPSFLIPPYSPITFSNNVDHKSTPPVYGGYYLHYTATSKLAINLNGYYFSTHTQYDSNDKAAGGALDGVGNITGKFILNSKINYTLLEGWDIYFNARNLLNSTSREFYGADITGGTYLIGAKWNIIQKNSKRRKNEE